LTFYLSRILNTPRFRMLIEHSGHFHVFGSRSNGIPGGIFWVESPFAGS
jgi:hypothetical protein